VTHQTLTPTTKLKSSGAGADASDFSLVLALFGSQLIQRWSPATSSVWTRTVKSCSCRPSIQSFLLITEEEFWAPTLEQDWELHL